MAMWRLGPEPPSPRPSPHGRVMLVFAQVSSMNTSAGRDPALMGPPAFTFARHVRPVCSSASSVFFEAQALGVNEHPYRPRMRLDPPFGQLGRQASKGERPGGDMRERSRVGALARECARP